jgi:crotonobetainyl-CoA:carnitine CoA-transferase CaiB-like acyl-CoA transferase
MGEYVAKHTTVEWLKRLDANDVPCAPILRRGEIVDNEQVVARDLIAEFDHPSVGRVRQPKPAARFDVDEAKIHGPAPRIGEHSREVMCELGYGEAEIAEMAKDRIIRIAS